MQLGEYYRGIPLNLVTRLPPDEVARRLNAALPSPYRPFATGIVGQVRSNRVRLYYRGGLFGYNGMPILTGPLELHPGGTLLRLLYRGRLGTRLAFPLAALMVCLGVGAVLFVARNHSTAAMSAGFAAGMAAALLACLALPLAIHVFAIRNAEARLETMAAFLRTTLDAQDTSVP